MFLGAESAGPNLCVDSSLTSISWVDYHLQHPNPLLQLHTSHNSVPFAKHPSPATLLTSRTLSNKISINMTTTAMATNAFSNLTVGEQNYLIHAFECLTEPIKVRSLPVPHYPCHIYYLYTMHLMHHPAVFWLSCRSFKNHDVTGDTVPGKY